MAPDPRRVPPAPGGLRDATWATPPRRAPHLNGGSRDTTRERDPACVALPTRAVGCATRSRTGARRRRGAPARAVRPDRLACVRQRPRGRRPAPARSWPGGRGASRRR